MSENGTALVTGAAGGIGSAVVERLARDGLRVTAVDLDAAGLSERIGEMRGRGLDVEAHPADLTDPDAVEALVEAVGVVEHLVNAAGVLHLGESWSLPAEDWAHTFAVNVTGTFRISQAVVAQMVKRGRGSVVTVASNAAGTPRTGMAAYAASKAAVAMFTRCLGLEVARYGVRCNVVAPGSTETPMLTSMWHGEEDREKTLHGAPEQYRLGIPMGRVAEPSDIADAVAFLLSSQARHITMETLTVDGGATLGV